MAGVVKERQMPSRPVGAAPGPGLFPTPPSPSLPTLPQGNAQDRRCADWVFWDADGSGLSVWRWAHTVPS